MADEIKKIITIDASKSIRTLREFQTAVDNARVELVKFNGTEEERQRLLVNLKKAQSDYNKEMRMAVKETNAAKGSYNDLLNQLNRLKEAWKSTGDAAKRADLTKEINRVKGQLTELDHSIGNYQRNVGNYWNSLKAGFATVTAGIMGVIAAIRTLSRAVKVIVEFEQSMANLGSILGATNEQMRGLEQSALQLGRTTEWTASQVVMLQTELAKLGFSSAAIENMQASVLQFATATGADLTVLEEANEFIERVKEGKNIPLFTSCCPAWVQYCERNYPELMPNVSTCKSPMQMFGAVIKEQEKSGRRKVINVAIMPCTAKKFEAARDEFKVNGEPVIDYVITTQELIQMIKEAGIVFDEIENEAIDMPFSSISGAGVIFGVTGGVTEAVIRRVSSDKSLTALRSIAYTGVRGLQGVKEFNVKYGDKDLRIAVVSGLGNADALIRRIKEGEHFDLVEVMACPGGCINGGGQPRGDVEERERRSKSLYESDRACSNKRSEENPLMMQLYNGLLKGKVHELLHVDYLKKE